MEFWILLLSSVSIPVSCGSFDSHFCKCICSSVILWSTFYWDCVVFLCGFLRYIGVLVYSIFNYFPFMYAVVQADNFYTQMSFLDMNHTLSLVEGLLFVFVTWYFYKETLYIFLILTVHFFCHCFSKSRIWFMSNCIDQISFSQGLFSESQKFS